MNLEQIGSILIGLGIDTQNLNEDSRLNDDLGMDSQEVVELCSELSLRTGLNVLKPTLARSARVKDIIASLLPAAAPAVDVSTLVDEVVRLVEEGEPSRVFPDDRVLTPAERDEVRIGILRTMGIDLEAALATHSRLRDVIDAARELTLFDGMAGAYPCNCELKLEMACNADQAFAALHRMREWPNVLPHVKQIRVVYDDGRFQEFWMDVAGADGMLNVRSVRRCEPTVGIRFFQPVPPAFLRHHAGGWKFRQLAPGRCEVTAFHCWELSDPNASAEQSRKVQELLTEHARLALTTWKQHLEGQQP